MRLQTEKWAASCELVLIAYASSEGSGEPAHSHSLARTSTARSYKLLSQEEPSDRKPDPWPLLMAGHAQLKFVMTGMLEDTNSLDMPRIVLVNPCCKCGPPCSNVYIKTVLLNQSIQIVENVVLLAVTCTSKQFC